jgi:hypothetical protein
MPKGSAKTQLKLGVQEKAKNCRQTADILVDTFFHYR